MSLIISAQNTKRQDTPENNKTLKLAVDYMHYRLRDASYWFLVDQINASGAHRTVKMASTTRGNRSYAFYQAERVEQLQHSIDSRAVIHGDSTNLLFLTLTHPYNKDSFDSIKQTWEDLPELVTKTIRRLRKAWGFTDYVVVFEAHADGGCHAHVAIILPAPVSCRRMSSVSKHTGKKTEILRLPDGYRDTLRKVYPYNSDIRGSDSPAIAGYLTKELGKVNQCEDALKRYDEGRMTRDDQKKIYAFYFACNLGKRLLRVSRSLPSMETLENELSDALINSCNNSTDKEWTTVGMIRLGRKELRGIAVFRPYSGVLQDDEAETAVLQQLVRGLGGFRPVKTMKDYYAYETKRNNENAASDWHCAHLAHSLQRTETARTEWLKKELTA
jgi:hypothetical protein